MSDADTHDAHLRHALRHAPDAQVQAPAALSDLILKEARAKARDAQPPLADPPRWAVRAFAWLARPAVATGFAGVMAATLVGLMWWDQPMDVAMPRSPAAAVAPKPAQPAVRGAPVVEGGRPDDEATSSNRNPALERKSADASRQERAERGARASAAGAAGTSAAVARPGPQPAVAPLAAPTQTPAPPTLSADLSSDALLAKARVEEEARKFARGSIAPAEAQRRRAAAKMQLNESRLQREGEGFTRVASVRATIVTEPVRWAWQRANGTAQPMSDAVYAWLAQLDGSAGTGWEASAARDTGAPRGRALVLLRDGQLQHRFQLTERGVLWDRGQTAWQVELPAEQVYTLNTDLDAVAP